MTYSDNCCPNCHPTYFHLLVLLETNRNCQISSFHDCPYDLLDYCCCLLPDGIGHCDFAVDCRLVFSDVVVVQVEVEVLRIHYCKIC